MDVREGMNDLFEKINKYVYEMQMIEIDEYLHGMNRRKIDMEKAYKMIIDFPDSEYNPVMNAWKGHFADPELPCYESFWVEANESEANEFYRMAVDLDIERMAEDGDKYAQTCLGQMYRYGRGVDQSDSSAVKWFRKAAEEQSHADAQNELGMMYEYGEGVDENAFIAAEWYRKAAEQSHADAQCNLGGIYHYAWGVDRDYPTAMEWYRKAAEQDYARGLFYLGVFYDKGYGVDENLSKAEHWYRKALERGYGDAQRNLYILADKISKEKLRKRCRENPF